METERDQVVDLPAGRRVLMDAVDAIRAPKGMGAMLVDLTAIDRVRKSFAEGHGVRPTYTEVLMKALAVTLRAHPEIHRLRSGYRVVEPSSVDIGVSVNGEGNLAPVAVVQRADSRPLLELMSELRERSRQARIKERADQKPLGRFARIVPWARLRKWLIARGMARADVIRRNIGTFQLSVLPFPEVDVIHVGLICTTGLLTVGGVRRRPLVVGERVEPRNSVWLTLHIDHVLIDGFRAVAFQVALKRLLEDEARLGEALAAG